jgi:hypothetical protein
MSGFRRFFWNYQKSFIGTKFAMTAPFEASKLVLAVALPLQALFIVHKGRSLSSRLLRE